jgi:hypothetical protein
MAEALRERGRVLSVEARGVLEEIGAALGEGTESVAVLAGGGFSESRSRLDRKSRASSALLFFPLGGMMSLGFRVEEERHDGELRDEVVADLLC